MSDSNPFGDDDQNPFAGLPIFGDLAKMFQAQGGSKAGWDTATQMAMQIATGGASEPNVDPLRRMELEQLVRVAELRVADVTNLPLGKVEIEPVNRSTWVERTLPVYRPRFETLSEVMSKPPETTGEELEASDGDAQDPTAALLGGMMQMMAPMMLGMTAGSMLGHLARKSLGQYDLAIPRPIDDPIMLIVPTVDEFRESWSLDANDLWLWLCLHELTHHAVLSVPHVRQRLTELLDEYSAGFRNDPSAIEDKLAGFDFSNLSDMAGMQSLLGDPELVLGAIRSPEQDHLLPVLNTLVTTIVGYVDFVMDSIGSSLISSYDMLTEALRRRRVEASDGDKFVEKIIGLELSQDDFDRGNAFMAGVVERAGTPALEKLWSTVESLPTPAELQAPGLWLARLDLGGDLPELPDDLGDFPDDLSNL